MSPTDWAILIPVLITAATTVAMAVRKAISWISQYGYERARAENYRERSEEAIEAKNKELQLEKVENAWLRQQNEIKDRTIERLTGGVRS